MRFSHILLSFGALWSLAYGQTTDDPAQTVLREKHDYQSDVARMREIVINSLYSHKEIFLRELISNANDAIEKLRLISLKNKDVYDVSSPLNITIKAVKDEDGAGGKIIITDTGIGMTPEELTTNLGTLAKSGTSDFISKSEAGEGAANANLIGAFGLGFYSSFLVADRVDVASLPPKSPSNPNPQQYVFSSSAQDSSFEIYPDPRGNTLGHGTEITLMLKPSASEYLQELRLKELVQKHSSFSSAFPIYLFTQHDEQVIDEEAMILDELEKPTPSATPDEPVDEDEAIVEDAGETPEDVPPPAPKMKTILVDEWMHLNSQPPIWARDPKEVSDEDYQLFYTSFFKDLEAPLAWDHFSGNSEDGIDFRVIVYLPSKLDDAYWQQPLNYKSTGVKLLSKGVFITSELGDGALPKWASWVKIVIDADNLPLNVSRETLQSTKFLRQLKNIILKHIISLIAKTLDDAEKADALLETYGSVIKMGAVEDHRNSEKLAGIARFTTNLRNRTSLDDYIENKKMGQKQIFYMAELAKEFDDIAKSVFVEKLHARGYEVLLLNEPLDEIFVQNLRKWKRIPFQDVAKTGLEFGDEDMDEEEEKEQQAQMGLKYAPLLDYLKEQAKGIVRDVVISNRLVTSPCAIVADNFGYTANVQKMMSTSHGKTSEQDKLMREVSMKARKLEINPRSPLIEGMLEKVLELPEDEDERDIELEEQLTEVASILIDGALIRSGFEIQDTNTFFSRVDRVLRRSLGVSETAPTDDTVKPAPPVDPEIHEDDYDRMPTYPAGFDEEDETPGVFVPEGLKNKMAFELEEVDEDGNPVKHDEL
ncbi:heat shock protein Hsp90 [Fistulina hepatica ATCC 64428]|nr:heat shock protein Hsp90 [Fistulina hepatica ATCC 64428]